MQKKNFLKRMIAIILSMAMILGCLPQNVHAEPNISAQDETGPVVTDPGTADAWEDIMGTANDGSRYAGRVWVDKSVYEDGDTVTLNRQGNEDSTFTVDVNEEEGEYFQVVFSALGSSMSSNTTITKNRPLDVVLVLDTSGSMTTQSSGKTRLQHMIEAANTLLKDLLEGGDVRVGIVSFNEDSETIIELDKYNDGINLSVNDYSNMWGGGVITATNNNGVKLGSDSGYQSGTNLQDGIHRGMTILAEAEDTDGRTPVAIVLADGRANHAVNEKWYEPSAAYRRSSGDAGILLSTLLNAAYGKTRVEKNYGTDMTVYGVGIDLSSSSDDYIFLNPGAEGSAGFNASNTDNNVKNAWNAFTTWRRGTTATMQIGGRNWVFDHNWPSSAGVTTTEIAANINYVDDYQDVKSAELDDAFDSIVQELITGAFNPITDTKNGATGVEDTPLIYVDNIGQYMEIRNIQAVQVFDTVYNVTKNADGTYSLADGSGVNPTTKENWNTANDIKINVIENADGTQQLRVYINQEILPILLDEITETTVNEVTTRTIDEATYPPLRIYYTVGIDSDILLPDGAVNSDKIDSDYAYVDNTNGTISFYSNAFGQTNTADTDGAVNKGDAHVGFVPSHENRYYYHQAHQEIFIDVEAKDGSDINWDDDMYGILWDENKYDLTAMTYEDAQTIQDTTRVYTYVTFIRPTGTGNEAEEVTYLVYTTWGALKSAVTYHDKVNDTNLNSGSAIALEQVGATVSAYKSGKNISDSDLIAILGLQSRRVSRLSNMFETKEDNVTDTAETSYAPEYNDGAHEDSDVHEHSEVIVWLGNNGKLTLPVGTGIKVTKDVTELADGASADEAFAIRVLLGMAYSNADALTVTDLDGKVLEADTDYTIAATNSNNQILITLNLADGKGAYIYGMPGDTAYTVTEAEHEKYEYAYTGATETVAGTIVEGTVTNTPVKPGNLYITKEVVHAHGGEVFPTGYEFEFEVTFKDKDGKFIANKEFKLENNYQPELEELTTDANGVMTGKLRHGETVYIKGIPAGATVTVKEVNIPDEYKAPVYRSRNASGETTDNDGVVTIVPEQNATVVVTNTYTPDPVDVNIKFTGTKNFDATHMDADSTFKFKLQEYKGNKWTDVEGKSASVTITKGNDAKQPFTFTDLKLEFTEPGVHSYQIVEEKGDNGDITYDRSVYTFSVNATLDEDGDLNAEVVGHNVDVTVDNNDAYIVKPVFTNYYHKTATSIAIKKSIVDSGNSGKTAAGFVIDSYEASVDADVWTIGDKIRSTVTDAQGEALLVRNYDNSDFIGEETTKTYHFIIKENKAGTTEAGWTYDNTHYLVTVTLNKATDGKITADFDVVKGIAGENGTFTASNNAADRAEINAETATAYIVFANTYDPQDAEVPLGTMVKKSLEGRQMRAGEFTFAIFNDGAASHTSIDGALVTGTNEADGNVTFEPAKLTFSEVGKYEYDIVEMQGNNAAMTYDPTIYDLVVEVKDTNGRLEASYYFEDSVNETVTFKNKYTVEPTEVVIDGIKTLQVNSGTRALKAGEFTFALYEGEEKIGETTNLANGTFKFDAIKYDADDIDKTYTYTVKEVAPDGTTDGSYSAGGVTWSGQSFTVTVEVIDNDNGTLSTEVTGVNGEENNKLINFVNEYDTEPVDVTLEGKKHLENRGLEAGEFEFGLFDAAGTEVKSVKNEDEGTFKFELNDLGAGNHYYVVKEIVPNEPPKGIYYSAAEYHITIRVTDNGTGQMTHTMSVVDSSEPDDTNADIEFTNTYIPEPTTYTIEAKKNYNKPLNGGEFKFKLEGEIDGTAISQEKTNASDGTITFDELNFSKAGTYTFKVKEIEKLLGFINYSAAEYEIVVEVSDKNGELSIGPVKINEDPDGTIEFTNTYVMDGEGEVALRGTKTLTGDRTTVEAGEFEFGLYDAEGKLVESVKNDANGNFAFSTLKFDETDVPVNGQKQITYTVKEIAGSDSAVTYDKTVYTVVVTVKDNDQGGVAVSYTVDGKANGELAFVNEYHVADVVIGKTQSVNGGNATKDKIAVEAGDEVTYYITVNNSGTKVATGIVIEDEIEDGLILDESSISDNGSYSNGVITWNIDELAGADKDGNPGTVTVSFTVEIPEVDEETVWENVATVDYEENDDEPEPSNEVEAEEAVEEIEETIEPEEPKDGEGSTKTGDEARIITYLFALLASLIAAFVALIVRRRNSYRR